MKYLSLFSGIGGFEVGINNSNKDWKCVGFSEIKKHSVKIYTNNFPDHHNFGDLTKIDLIDLPEFDVLVGGFPCQPYSLASNKRDGLNDDRGKLFFNILNIIRSKKPKLIFLENVRGLENHNSGHTFWLIKRKIRKLGYKVHTKILNSKDFGVPHNRTRLYFVCFREDITPSEFNFPEGSDYEGSFYDILETDPSENVFLTPAQIFKMKGFGTQNCFSGYLSRSRIYNCITASYKIDGGNSMKFIRDGRISALSPIECERLQGFPDEWTRGISSNLRYETLGNAVTTKTITAIVNSIPDLE